MAKVMLINVTHAEESRVAIVADGTLVSFEIESFNREHLKGNIYKGVVQRVHPALDAAFVDIGADRDAFLPLDEICFRNLPHPVRVGSNGERRRPRIHDVLKPGDEILVQIVKEQFGSKPPTLTTFFSLPGRFLVLLPGSDEAGISRRIEGADRVRVRELVEKLQPPEGFGIIVRTVVGFDPGLADLQRDLTYLLRLWERIRQVAQSKRAPALIYREHDLVLRNIRDYFTPDIDEIYIDNEEVFERARQFLRDVLPEKEHVLRLYQGDKPIFSHFNIESQIESIYKRRVPLKSGGYIVIDGTEALTAIDVNSGRATRGANQEETAFRTNLEAAVEIARQLRLRDVGGLIVIDFIDMRNPQHISEVEKALRTAMFEDKARHEVGRISHFGLLEVSRQRLRPAATATTYVTCKMCDGYGLVRTTESAALVALRKVHNRVAQGDAASVKVSLPTDVAMYLLNQKREDLAQLERRYAVKILVETRDDLMPHQCEIDVKTRSEAGEKVAAPTLRLGGVALPIGEPAPSQQDGAPVADEGVGSVVDTAAKLSEPAVESQVPPSSAGNGSRVSAPTESAERAGRKRRRRGRRKGRGRLAAESLQIMVQTLAAHAGGTAIDREQEPERAAPGGSVQIAAADASVNPTLPETGLAREEMGVPEGAAIAVGPAAAARPESGDRSAGMGASIPEPSREEVGIETHRDSTRLDRLELAASRLSAAVQLGERGAEGSQAGSEESDFAVTQGPIEVARTAPAGSDASEAPEFEQARERLSGLPGALETPGSSAEPGTRSTELSSRSKWGRLPRTRSRRRSAVSTPRGVGGVEISVADGGFTTTHPLESSEKVASEPARESDRPREVPGLPPMTARTTEEKTPTAPRQTAVEGVGAGLDEAAETPPTVDGSHSPFALAPSEATGEAVQGSGEPAQELDRESQGAPVEGEPVKGGRSTRRTRGSRAVPTAPRQRAGVSTSRRGGLRGAGGMDLSEQAALDEDLTGRRSELEKTATRRSIRLSREKLAEAGPTEKDATAGGVTTTRRTRGNARKSSQTKTPQVEEEKSGEGRSRTQTRVGRGSAKRKKTK